MCLKRQVPYQPIIPPSTYAFNLAHWPPASVEFDDDPTAVASNFQQITTNMDVYNNNTIELFRRLNLTIDCFQRYISNTSVDLLDYLSYPPNDQVVVNRSVCSVCMPLYIDLVDYYENSIQSADQMDPSFTATTLDVIIQRTEQPNPSFTTCFDVQRTVNRTEWAWAHLLHCQAEGNRVLGAVLPLLVCVVFLLLFHTVLCTVFRNPVHSVVYRPKRVEPRHPAGLSRQNTFSSQPRGLARYGSLAQNASQYGSTQALIHSYRVDRDQDERSRLLPQWPPPTPDIFFHSSRFLNRFIWCSKFTENIGVCVKIITAVSPTCD